MANPNITPIVQAMGMNSTELASYILDVTHNETMSKHHAECLKYGTFMTHFSRAHLEGMFWALFGLVLILLCTASYSHAESEKLQIYDDAHPMETPQLKARHQRSRVKAVIVTTICFTTAAACVALEGLAGTALNYCHQHKVINFYWAMWGLLQVGSLIAILGVTIHQWVGLREHSSPPWNIALGTPILVIASGAFFVVSWMRGKWAASKGAGEKDEQEDIAPPGMIKGIAENGALIVQFYRGEWKDIPDFKVVRTDKHGGATGMLSFAPTVLERPVSGATTIGAGSQSSTPLVPKAEV